MTPRVLLPACLVLAVGCSSSPAVEDGSDAAPGPSDVAASGEITTLQIEVGELVFDARVAGPIDGEPVFLLHGFPQTSYEWRSQLSALGEAGYRAIAPDQRGYSPGARPPNVEDYGIVFLVQDVLGMADAVGVDRFHIVGHDWGAAVTWALGVFAPDRVITVNAISVPHPDAFSQVLSDPTSCQYSASAYFDIFVQPDAEDAFLADDAAFFRGFFAGLPQHAIDEYVRALGSKEALGAALNWYRANIRDRTPEGGMVGPVTKPTSFIWSDGDVALCRDGAELTAGFVDAPYRFEIVEGVSHWVPDLAPEIVNDVLVDHLSSYPDDG